MRIEYSKLKHLPVRTVSGTKLGKVHDLVFDVDGHQILQYVVKPNLFGTDTYLIGKDQVVRITAELMEVDDSVGRAKKTVPEPAQKRAAGPEPVAMRKEG